ncbi:hypothetical protein GS892_25520 [Rhodococcus hoagii]|nr:hypothetical protein [Prescottella equi]
MVGARANQLQQPAAPTRSGVGPALFQTPRSVTVPSGPGPGTVTVADTSKVPAAPLGYACSTMFAIAS